MQPLRILQRCTNSLFKRCLLSLVAICLSVLIMQDIISIYLDSYINQNYVPQPKSTFLTLFRRTSGFTENEVVNVKFMTSYFGEWVNHWRDIINVHRDSSCPKKCDYSYSKGPDNGTDAHVLVFHANDLDKHSEYLPYPRNTSQIWLLMNAEAPWLTRLEMSLHNNVFNWTSFVRYDSDSPMYYSRKKKAENTSQFLKEEYPKKKHAYWMVSNCYATNSRDAYIDELKRHMRLDVYSSGPCQPGSLRCLKGHAQCLDLAHEYNFYIAFENANCRDYISEKLWRSLKTGVIPVVMGDSEGYKRAAPPGSYIDIADFTSAKDLAEYMIKVEQNLTLYRSYFSWRREYNIVDEWLCDLCETLHRWDGTHQVYSDLSGWYSQDSCVTWNIVGDIYSRTSVVWRLIKRWIVWTLGLSN